MFAPYFLTEENVATEEATGILIFDLELCRCLGTPREAISFRFFAPRLAQLPFDQRIYRKPARSEDQYDQCANEIREGISLHKLVRVTENARYGFYISREVGYRHGDRYRNCSQAGSESKNQE